MSNVIYCNECGKLEKRKSGSGYRYYCPKEDKYFPINYTEKDIETSYCIDGKVPRKNTIHGVEIIHGNQLNRLTEF